MSCVRDKSMMKLILLVYMFYQWHVSLAKISCKYDYVQPYNCSIESDYYWRDFNGVIPNDAIPGGSEDDNITYLGQVLYKESLLSATIYPSKKEAVTNAYGQVIRTQKSVKILCSQYKDSFRWITTSVNEIHLMTDFSLVIGGTEVGHVLNIGRVNFEQRVIIGKVFPPTASNKGLWVARRDGKEQNFHSFEILASEKSIKPNCYNNCSCV